MGCNVGATRTARNRLCQREGEQDRLRRIHVYQLCEEQMQRATCDGTEGCNIQRLCADISCPRVKAHLGGVQFLGRKVLHCKRELGTNDGK